MSESQPPRRIGRSVGAVLVGAITGIVLSIGTDMALRAAGVFPPLGQPMAGALFLLATAYRTVYGVAGSYIAARLAPHRPMAHALALGVLGTAVSIVGVVATWNSGPELGPKWYPLALVALGMPQSWAGGDSGRRSCAKALLYNGFTMRLRVGVIDSGVQAAHPHVGGVAGGVAIAADGSEESDYTDRLGHGTAVTAVIREKAPEAHLFAVRIFHDKLASPIGPLVRAIDWCLANGMHLINLSLGTDNPAHEAVLSAALDRVRAAGAILVAAHQDAGVRWLPGSLAGALPVALDWDCPRGEYRTAPLPDGRILYRASGFARPIPGVPPERNLKGISFAVANVTGLLAREGRHSWTA